jgi:hypothetical protein
MFAPSTYEGEEEIEKVVITANRTETVKEKVKVQKPYILSYRLPLVILPIICFICCAYAVYYYDEYDMNTNSVGLTQRELPKWQSQLKSLAPAAV